MPEPTTALTLQLLEWIAEKPRTYAEVLDAWRTTCPRLSIWEDACIDGLIDNDPDGDRIVCLSPNCRILDPPAAKWTLAPGRHPEGPGCISTLSLL